MVTAIEGYYRFIHPDAGHVCQNLSLTAEEISRGVCVTGKYDDQAINVESVWTVRGSLPTLAEAIGKAYIKWIFWLIRCDQGWTVSISRSDRSCS